MRMIEDIKPLILYNSKKTLYAPVNDKDKRRGSAILLLTPNIEESIKLTRAPYIHNQNIYTSYYIDRDITKFINIMGEDNLNLDEVEANAMSEAAVMSSKDSKIIFDDNTSVLQKRYMMSVFNKQNINYICKTLGLLKKPKKIVIKVHQSIQELKRSIPKYIANNYDSNLFSYTDNNEMHVLSYSEHDSEVMGAPYNIYLLNELIILLVKNANSNLGMNALRSIGCVYSGQYDLVKSGKYQYFDLGKISRGCKLVDKYRNIDNGYKIKKYIKSASILSLLGKDKLNESTLSSADRDSLTDQEFGIPYKRKYPLNDKDHVLAAIRMFNKCDIEDEEVLASNIIKRLKKLRISDINVGITNRFSKYYTKSIKESIILEDKYYNISSYPIDIYKNYDSFKDKFNDIKIDGNTYGNIYADKDKVYGMYSYQMTKNGAILTSFISYDDNEFIISRMLNDIINYDGIEDIYIDNIDQEAIDIFSRNFDIVDETDTSYHMRLQESTMFEGAIEDPEYHDILQICKTLTPQEFSKISFDKIYRNSPFVIKRIIHKIDGIPAGFLDVYLFPSNPSIAQIVIAVNSNYRGLGLSNKMVKDLLNSKLHEQYEFDYYYWTAHSDNYISQAVATKNGFVDTSRVDKFGRKIYVLPTNSFTTIESSTLLEADNKYMKKYLYNERIRNTRDMRDLYEKVKMANPIIKKTYNNIDQYKGLNLYVDLSYYHSLFLKNENKKLSYKNRIEMYLELLTKLLSSIKTPYNNQTVLIPVDLACWNVSSDTDLLDFKTNLNPFSLIAYLTRFKTEALRKLFKNKKVLFVNDKGYFTVNFDTFELKNMIKFKSILGKLTSNISIIEDDEDDIYAGSSNDTNSNQALVAKTIDHIESISPVKIDNITPTVVSSNIDHLSLVDNFKLIDKSKDGVIVICLDPDGSNSQDISNIKIKADTYTTPA